MPPTPSRYIRLALRPVLVLAASLLLLSMPLGARSAIPAQAASSATALGEVRYIFRGLAIQPPGEQPRPGRVTQALYSRYVLKTAVSQRASLRFRDGTVLHMSERTDAQLRSPNLTYVGGGEVNQILAPGTKHQIQTSSATAAAVGTNFDVRIVGKQTLFIVLEGSLQVSNKYGTVYVKNNQATDVASGSRPQTPIRYNAGDALKWTATLPAPDPPLETNIALDANGGHVLATSSQSSDVHFINDGRLDSGWSSGSGQVSNQWVKLGFKADALYTIRSVILDPSALRGHEPSAALKTFKIRVSTTGSDDRSFVTVYKAIAKHPKGLQRFVFPQPVQAKYLELYALDNDGSSQSIDVTELIVVGRLATPAATVHTCPITQDCITMVLDLLNSTRDDYGLRPYTLSEDQSLGTASCVGAYGHSAAMAESGFLWHTNAKYVHASFPADICLLHKTASENIGEAGSGNEVQALSSLYQQEMKEPHDPATCKRRLPTHSCNILNPAFTRVGIGITFAKGRTWLTIDFVG